jgi:hypothetical protein
LDTADPTAKDAVKTATQMSAVAWARDIAKCT